MSRRASLLLLALLGLTAVAAGAAAPAGDGPIVFSRRCGTSCADLYVVRPDGRGLRRLTANAVAYDPAWSPDGTRIVFASDRGQAGAPRLYWMRAEGGSKRRLTSGPLEPVHFAADADPAWSPDGRTIAFSRQLVRGSRTDEDVHLLDLRSLRVTRLTTGPERDADPALSPDGRRIAFTRIRGSVQGVSVQELATRRATRVAAGGGQPVWSPDGTRIAFARDGGAGIFVVAASGGRARKIPGTRGATEPVWSPDGRRILFSRTAEGGPASSALYVVGLDGSGLRRLTRPGPLWHDLAPDWRRGR